jgi:DNA-directed RNA polymerase specialized sigma subunit
MTMVVGWARVAVRSMIPSHWRRSMGNALDERLANGEDVVVEVIESYMPLALKVAGYYMSLDHRRADTIKSIALETLTVTINKIYTDKGSCKNLRNYVHVRVRGDILNFFNRDKLMVMPSGRQQEVDTDTESYTVESVALKVPFRPVVISMDGSSQSTLSNIHEAVAPAPMDTRPIGEYLDSMNLTPRELRVVELRLEGFNMTEIAKQLDTYKVEIFRVLKRIQERMGNITPGKKKPVPEGLRMCVTCNTEKTYDHFYIANKAAGTFRGTCKECMSQK